MKRILLIEDGRPFWPRIRDLLRKVNAAVDVQSPGDPFPPAGERRPELVVIGDSSLAARAPGWWDGALLVLEKGRDPDLVTRFGDSERQFKGSSSIGERAFLELTSRLIGVSERRLFHAVISVRRVGQDHAHMGASREFSLTGLSFALAAELQPAEQILISFFVPGAQRRVVLAGEVVRSFHAPEDGSRCYGVRFVGLSADEQQVLNRFVLAAG